MNEQEFLKLLSAVAKVAKPFSDDVIDIPSMSEDFSVFGFDSLDMLLTGIYMCDIFGVDEELSKTMLVKNSNELFDFLMKHKTKMPVSVEEALKEIQ